MTELTDAVISGAPGPELARCELPGSYRAAHILKSEATMFAGTAGLSTVKGWRQLGEEIRRQVGEDPHIVFEHAGRETFAASVYVARRGGTVVTCGSSTGYQHEYDNRHLWMKVKRIVGSHGANYQESWEANRLVRLGMLAPTLSVVHPLAEVAEATRAVQLNLHTGKVGVLCLAPREGMGIADPTARDTIGADRLRLFRGR